MTTSTWPPSAWWLERAACGIECLHHIIGRSELTCCGCGKQFADPVANLTAAAPSFQYRIDFDHTPSGPYYPSILAANRNAHA